MAVVLAAMFPSPLRGQVSITVGVAQTEVLGGQWGGDARLWVDPPLSPVAGYLAADYFLADCTTDCGLWGWRIGGTLKSGFPILQPYLTGAYVFRKLELGGGRSEVEGIALGAGVRLHSPLNLFAEATWEFLGGPLEGWSVRLGFGF